MILYNISWKEVRDMRDEVIKYRKEHGLSRKALAEKCGINELTLQRVEEGKKPSLIVQGKIEKVIMEEK